MNYSMLKRCMLVTCLPVIGMLASQVQADWYSNDPQLNRNQGFGDFPPTTIDQDLQQRPNMLDREESQEPRQYRNESPWNNDFVPLDHSYQPYPGSSPEYDSVPYTGSDPWTKRDTSSAENITQQTPQQAPAYNGYNPGGVAIPYGNQGLSGPWNNPGSGYQLPRNNTGSNFNPWGGRGRSGSGMNPFGMSGPGNWFD